MSSNRFGPSSKASHRSRSGGVALIAVLWAVLLLAALAGTAMYVARTYSIFAHRTFDLARAQAIADAAIATTIMRLADERMELHAPLDGTAQTWRFDGIDVSISATRESGRIDVNRADDLLLEAFLQLNGISVNRSHSMLTELRERQDSDDNPRGQGAPTASFRDQHPAIGPGRRLLESVDELRKLRSWNTPQLDCLMESLTVYSGQTGVSFVVANSAVRAALRFAQEHHLEEHDRITTSESTSSVVGQRSEIGSVLRVRATAIVSAEVTATVEWIGRVTGDAINPVLTMRWSPLEPGLSESCKS